MVKTHLGKALETWRGQSCEQIALNMGSEKTTNSMHSALECQQTPNPSQCPCSTTGNDVIEGTLIQLESIAEVF